MLEVLERFIGHISTPLAIVSVSLAYLIVGFAIIFAIRILYEERQMKKNGE